MHRARTADGDQPQREPAAGDRPNRTAAKRKQHPISVVADGDPTAGNAPSIGTSHRRRITHVHVHKGKAKKGRSTAEYSATIAGGERLQRGAKGGVVGLGRRGF